ncbi:MAG: hypothetical protein NVSMB65_17520 [Chloroflexota bacterium]
MSTEEFYMHPIMDNLLTHIVLSKSRADALKRYVIAALHVDLALLMERDTALIQRVGDVPVRVKTAGWFRSRRRRRAVAATRAVLTKADALAHQAAVLAAPACLPVPVLPAARDDTAGPDLAEARYSAVMPRDELTVDASPGDETADEGAVLEQMDPDRRSLRIGEKLPA